MQDQQLCYLEYEADVPHVAIPVLLSAAPVNWDRNQISRLQDDGFFMPGTFSTQNMGDLRTMPSVSRLSGDFDLYGSCSEAHIFNRMFEHHHVSFIAKLRPHGLFNLIDYRFRHYIQSRAK